MVKKSLCIIVSRVLMLGPFPIRFTLVQKKKKKKVCDQTQNRPIIIINDRYYIIIGTSWAATLNYYYTASEHLSNRQLTKYPYSESDKYIVYII